MGRKKKHEGLKLLVATMSQSGIGSLLESP